MGISGVRGFRLGSFATLVWTTLTVVQFSYVWVQCSVWTRLSQKYNLHTFGYSVWTRLSH
jgi:hypothetical protein